MQSDTDDTFAAIRRFEAIVDALPDPLTIIELGACDGFHTKLMAGYLKRRNFRYFAFEPDPRLLDRLLDNAPAQVDVVNAAVGATDGSTDLWLSSGSGGGQHYYGSSSIKRPKSVLTQHPGIKFDETVSVEVVRLDSFVELVGIDSVDFIWADLQGAEGDMIEGARKTLTRTRWLYIEADGNNLYEDDVNEDQICKLLKGWENMGRIGGDLLFRNRAL